MDLRGCEGLHVYPDGTLLARINDCLVRFDRHGKALKTWPQHNGFLGLFPQRLRRLYGDGGLIDRIDHRCLPQLRSYPKLLKGYYPSALGSDGTLFAVVRDQAHAFRGDGRRLYCRRLPDVVVERNRIGTESLLRL